MANDTLLKPEERVLSTMEQDGSRRWLKPRLSRGRFWHARRIVAYLLIVIFTAIPYTRINGKPTILLDIVNRQFTFFGQTFLPTDSFLLALLLLTVLLSIFLMTALFGRVWCGWACPQTVYLEFVYRPIERLIDGVAGRGGASRKGGTLARRVLRYSIYLLLSMYLAHTFLAYFVGVEALRHWVLGSPLNHPVAFTVMAVTTAAMMFDFCFFREQTCIIACPYGRFQSVLLDRQSLIVNYDRDRGEPRGKARQSNADGDISLPQLGDCVDCTMCVQVCPTGIDIREGLQMECVGCTQCIDACDEVMDRVGRPRGLIRYGTQAAMSGEKTRILRPRVVVYPALLLVVLGVFVVALGHQARANVSVLRAGGRPFTVLEDGRVASSVNVKIVNRTDKAATYTLSLHGVEGWHIDTMHFPMTLDPGESRSRPVLITTPRTAYRNGMLDIRMQVDDEQGEVATVATRLIGPVADEGTTP